MRNWLWWMVFAELGLIFVGFGLLIPAHMRAIDAAQLELAGLKTRSVIEEGASLTRLGKVGPAQLFLQAAQAENIRGAETLAAALTNLTAAHPELLLFGGADPTLDKVFPPGPAQPRNVSQPLADFVRKPGNLERLIEFLRAERRPVLIELLKTRELTQTLYFPPVASPAGQTLDTMIGITGLLLLEDHLAPPLRDKLVTLILETTRTGNTRRIEEVFLDLYSLSKRLNWSQLSLFVGRIEDFSALAQLARTARTDPARLPALFTAVGLSGQPTEVAGYLAAFHKTGLKDLSFSLASGSGGVEELLRRKLRVYYPFAIRQTVLGYEPFTTYFARVLDWTRSASWATLSLKYVLFLAGGFYLARSCRYWKPPQTSMERLLQVPGVEPARQGLWALLFLLVLVLLSEPFLAQETQQVETPLRPRLPKLSAAVPAAPTPAPAPFMNQWTILSLSLFFVLQALIYLACLLKLSEIRRQDAAPRLKLRLLENEEHLFDAGLYLGFVGTIISLIVMSMGAVKFSLMAGYSSTSFGIIFVSILKIFHVRPLRRKLILESETPTP